MITVVLVVWLVFSLVKRGSHPDHHLDLKETPRQILDRRFAAGEIDAAAYSQSRTLLEGKSS
jgi:putative membrane protein